MKKKIYVVTFMTLFMLSAAAFHYEGSKDKASASLESKELEKAIKNETQVSIDHSPVQNETSEIQNEPSEGQSVKMIGSQQQNLNEENSNSQDIQSANSILIDGEWYHLLMDKKKYPNLTHLITVAGNYGAKLYGIENSDVMAIVKDGKIIVKKSTGITAALKNHSAILYDLFSEEGYSEFRILENIKFVIETDAKVQVDWPNYGYTIYPQDEWIVVSY